MDRAESKTSRATAFFTSTTGWTMVVCLLGIATILQPFTPMARVESIAPDLAGKLLPPNPYFESPQVFGYESAYTILVGATFSALFLLLFATGFIQPIPLWRSVTILIAGVFVLIVMTLAFQPHGLRRGLQTQIQTFFEAWPSVIWPIIARTMFPMHVATALGCCLVLFGTIQLRGVLMLRHRGMGE